MPQWLDRLLYVLLAVGVAVLANYLAALWGSRNEKFSWLLVAVIVISPLVFVTFGLVTTRLGVAVGSGTIDSLLTVCTVGVGLVAFNEWAKLGLREYIGLGLIVLGLMVIHLAPTGDVT